MCMWWGWVGGVGVLPGTGMEAPGAHSPGLAGGQLVSGVCVCVWVGGGGVPGLRCCGNTDAEPAEPAPGAPTPHPPPPTLQTSELDYYNLVT